MRFHWAVLLAVALAEVGVFLDVASTWYGLSLGYVEANMFGYIPLFEAVWMLTLILLFSRLTVCLAKSLKDASEKRSIIGVGMVFTSVFSMIPYYAFAHNLLMIGGYIH